MLGNNFFSAYVHTSLHFQSLYIVNKNESIKNNNSSLDVIVASVR